MNEDEFRQLFADHADDVHRFAVRRVGADGADDIVSDVFLIAWRRRDDVPLDRPRAWLLTTARWVLADNRRALERRSRLVDRIGPPGEQPDPAGAVAATVDVRRALATLTAADQEALRLVEWDQLTHRDAASIAGCGTAAFSVRLRRARSRLAKALADLPDRSAVSAGVTATDPTPTAAATITPVTALTPAVATPKGAS